MKIKSPINQCESYVYITRSLLDLNIYEYLSSLNETTVDVKSLFSSLSDCWNYLQHFSSSNYANEANKVIFFSV